MKYPGIKEVFDKVSADTAQHTATFERVMRQSTEAAMSNASVKRYDSMGFESEHGIYVRAVDYDALVDQESKSWGAPILWLRMRNGKPDWSENCVGPSEQDVIDDYPEADGYKAIPLYAAPEGNKPESEPALTKAIAALKKIDALVYQPGSPEGVALRASTIARYALLAIGPGASLADIEDERESAADVSLQGDGNG